MAPSIRLVAFLSAVALQVGLSTSADTTISLLVAEVPLSTRVEASIITVIQSLSETRLRISCPDYDGVENNPPCNVIHGATVTMNPGGVTMSVSRDGNRVTIPAENIEIALETNLVVSGTATCSIYGNTSASCTGHVTSSGIITTHPAPTSLGNNLRMFGVQTISSQIGSSGGGSMMMSLHMVPVTVTAGLEHLPVQTTSTPFAETSSSTGGAPRATGIERRQAVVAGVVALAGGVILV